MNLDFCWAVLTLLYSSAQPSLAQFSRRATLAFFSTQNTVDTLNHSGATLSYCIFHDKSLSTLPLPVISCSLGPEIHMFFYIVSSTALASTAVFRYKVWEFLWFCFTRVDRWQFMFVSWEVLLSPFQVPASIKSQLRFET